MDLNLETVFSNGIIGISGIFLYKALPKKVKKTDLGAGCHGLNPLSHQVCWSFGQISNNFILFAHYKSNVKDCL